MVPERRFLRALGGSVQFIGSHGTRLGVSKDESSTFLRPSDLLLSFLLEGRCACREEELGEPLRVIYFPSTTEA